MTPNGKNNQPARDARPHIPAVSQPVPVSRFRQPDGRRTYLPANPMNRLIALTIILWLAGCTVMPDKGSFSYLDHPHSICSKNMDIIAPAPVIHEYISRADERIDQPRPGREGVWKQTISRHPGGKLTGKGSHPGIVLIQYAMADASIASGKNTPVVASDAPAPRHEAPAAPLNHHVALGEGKPAPDPKKQAIGTKPSQNPVPGKEADGQIQDPHDAKATAIAQMASDIEKLRAANQALAAKTTRTDKDLDQQMQDLFAELSFLREENTKLRDMVDFTEQAQKLRSENAGLRSKMAEAKNKTGSRQEATSENGSREPVTAKPDPTVAKLRIRMLSGKSDLRAARDMAAYMQTLGYQVSAAHWTKAAKERSDTIYYTKNHRQDADTLMSRLKRPFKRLPAQKNETFDLVVFLAR